MKRWVVGILMLGLLMVLPAQAQKATDDPRPLRGLDRSHLPRYDRSAVHTLLHAHPAADLTSKATVVGRAERVPVALGAIQTLQATGSPTTTGSLRLVRADNGTIRWLQGPLGRAEGITGAGKQVAAQYTQAAVTAAEQYADLLRLDDPMDELRPMETTIDDLGYAHARFEQTYEGVPVWGRDLYVHVDATGALYAINGTYEPTPRGLDTTPVLATDAALATVEQDLRRQNRWAPLADDVAEWLGIDGPATRLVVYPDEERGMRLAYEVTLHPNLLEWYSYFIDAQDGTVLHRLARHCTLWHEGALDAAPAVSLQRPEASKTGAGGTFFNATAADLNGQTQSLRVYQHDDGFFYKVWDLPNLNLAQSTLPSEPAGGALTISANNTDFGEDVNLTHVVSTDNTWADPVSVSAHVNMQVAYDYYNGTHARGAIDGNDQSIISIVHVTDGGQPMENAFWNGRVMAYGDGGQFFKPLAGGLDVAGHEMSHGVIQHTADLVYQFQSGALNESFADVFGAMVDRDDLLMGEDIMQNHLALRDLANPDNPQVLAQQPAHMSQFQNLTADQDNGGVHVNSGIPNRAAALVIQSLGRDKTEAIYYRALSNYLTRNSQFGDARIALEQAATDLFGGSSAEVNAVQEAFDAVGILDTSGSGGDEGNDLPPQTGGSSFIAFLLEDGTIGYIDITDPSDARAFIFSDPGAVARVDASIGDRSQLSTPKNGERIWFINQDFKLAFIDIESGEVSVFNDLFIEEEGDLWNASIAPDETFVALVSAYADDPTLYFSDGEDLFPLPLEAETTQDGIKNTSIQYPDVVSWSPNPSVLKVAFDAFNEVAFGEGGQTINYWSMYEIDFQAETIFNLVPAQPQGSSVGNVTYSNNDPDIVAFNFIDADGEWDVRIGDFGTGDVVALNIPSFTIDNVPIEDAQRPTFSPDDTQLAFTSPDHSVLLVFDGPSGGLTYYDFQGTTFYNPRWFVRGGSGGTQNQAPTARFNVSATSGTAPLLVGFDASASSDPNGDDLTYRWDFGDGSVGSGAATGHTFAASGTFTITLTVTDSGGLNNAATVQVQVTDTGVAVDDESELPRSVVLHPNYPNPFNPETRLRFDLPAAAEVELIVLDVTGRRVATLVQGSMAAGRHEVAFEAKSLPSGLYLARLQAGSVTKTHKMVLLK